MCVCGGGRDERGGGGGGCEEYTFGVADTSMAI